MNALLLCGFAGQAGLAAELPAETFFRNYRYREARLSPDGDYLAALAPDKNRVGLAIIDLKTLKANWAFGDRETDVTWLKWATNDRLLFRLAKNGYTLAGLLAVNRDGKKFVPLVRVDDVRTRFLTLLPHSSDEILVTSLAHSKWDQETGYFYPHVERMNILTGYMTREVKNPGHVLSWVTDHDGVVRAGLAFEGTQFRVLYRATTNAAWQSVADFRSDEDEISPIGFDYDNKTMLVWHHGDLPTLGIYVFDLEKKQPKALAFRHAKADADRLIFSDRNRVVAGVAYDTERPEVFWFNPQYRAMQETVDRALPGYLNSFVNSSRDETKWVVLSSNDRTPGTYYLLDRATGHLQKLFELADWIHPDEMAEMRPIEYQARDGMAIHGYLTVPPGSAGKNLPLVVNPHGGPIERDTWGFDPEVQFLANRGYAVLRMNFRGSSGYGWDFTRAGFKEWGYKQQDDITDGVKWAIAQGIADPKRVCICGASYGGYATLVGLEKTPELYRCGICMAGVTDILRILKKREFNGNALELMKANAAQEIGDRKADRARLEQVTPLKHVDQIRVPVLMAHGELDPIVPVAEGRDMAKALKSRGKLYDFIVKEDEGHGFHKEENRIEFWKKVDEFLKANMN